MARLPVAWANPEEWMRKAAYAVNDLQDRTQYVGTVAKLPTGGQGMRAFVTDATSTTFGAAAVGGGANKVPAFHDGTGWKIG